MGCCAAPNCSNSDKKGYKLYCFPSESERRKKWLINCRRERWTPTKYSRLCSVHFEQNQFELARADGWKKLKPNAVPTLFNVPNPPPKLELRRKPQSRNKIASTAKGGKVENVAELKEDNVEHASDSITEENKKIKELTLQNAILKRKLRKFQEKQNKSLKNLDKFLSPEQIVNLAIDKGSTTPKWSNGNIIKCLKIRFALGKNGYMYLRNTGYPAPSYSTLNRKIQNLNMDFGLYNKLIPALAAKVSAMKEFERDCVLFIDEMQIQPENCFDPSTKKFYGHITLGDANEVGNHITVIILRGLNTNWKQIMSCDVTGSSTEGTDTIVRINEVISVAHSVKLKLRGIVSDMGSNNIAMWNMLGVEVSRNIRVPFFLSKGLNIHIFADFQHLLKNLKSAMLNKSLIIIDKATAAMEELPTVAVNGDYVRQLWDKELTNNPSGLRYLHHLKDADVYPNHYNKMNVGGATRFFSVTTAAGLETAVRLQILDKEALTTAWFIRLIWTWHCLVASRSRKASITSRNMGNKLQFLEKFIKIVQLMKIGEGGWKPLNTGLIMSTLSFINLSKELFEKKYLFLLGSRLTQDALENIFSQVRRKAGKKPNALECKRTMKLLVVSQYVSDINDTNYCSDTDTHLIDLIKHFSQEDTSNCENGSIALNSTASQESSDISVTDKNNLYYIAGSIVNRLLKKAVCSTCTEFLSNSNKENVDNACVFLTEYSNLGGLIFVNESIFSVIIACEKVFINKKNDLLYGNISLDDNVITATITERCSEIFLPECCNIKQAIIKDFLVTRSISYAKYVNTKPCKMLTARGSASFR